jgi:hypothetical protein
MRSRRCLLHVATSHLIIFFSFFLLIEVDCRFLYDLCANHPQK